MTINTNIKKPLPKIRKRLKNKLTNIQVDIPNLLLVLTISFYIIGGMLIRENVPYYNKYIQQEHFILTDEEGEEYEDDGLIEIEGVGSVLSYKEIYQCTIPFLIISCILARVIFNSTDEIRFMIYTNCILGLLLIWLTTKSNIPSTILYWCGIITASFADKKVMNHE